MWDSGATAAAGAENSGRNNTQALHGRLATCRAGFYRLSFRIGLGIGRLIIEAALQGGEFGFSVAGGQDAEITDFLETGWQAVL